MQLIAGELVVSPTDLTRFLACRHLSRLDVEVARGLRPPPSGTPAAELELLFRRGLDHERGFLAELRARREHVVEIDLGRFAPGPEGLRAAEAATVEAMAAGADVVHQATFFDGVWRGHADFLLRRDLPGRWAWSYDVVDTKLARRAAVPALLQLAAYAERLTVLQGVPPEQLVVVTGDGRPHPYPYRQLAAAARRLRAAFTEFLADPPATVAVPVRHCGQCRWQPDCRARWRAADDLALVAGLRRVEAERLRDHGIATVAALAAADPVAGVPGLSRPALERLVGQARLQMTERRTGRPAHRVLPPVVGRGLASLPAPSPGDVFFDIEGDPFAGEGGLEYLFGLVDHGRYTGYWALDLASERAAFEAVVDHLIRSWDADPGMHVYHYAPYEPTRLKALAGRYDTRVDEIDRLLRGNRLVDLYTVVKQGVQVGKESYSLKKLEDHYWGRSRAGAAVGDALSSVVAFEQWLLEGRGDPADPRLEGIRAYNEDDCRSTLALRDWLEVLRRDAGGDQAFPRPEHSDGTPSEQVRARGQRSAGLRAALQAHAASRQAKAASGQGQGEAEGVRLLAALLDWHRREALPAWSDYFRRRGLGADELVADPVALAGLHDATAIGRVRRSVRWELRFPPQETALVAGDDGWSDPVTGQRAGVIAHVDAAEGRLVLDRAAGRGAPAVSALVPPGPVGAEQLEARLAELAGWVARHGIDAAAPPWRAGRDLLLRRPIQGEAGGPLRRPGESALDAALRLMSGPAGSPPAPGVLAVQGPPGTGKTYVAARVVLQALADGRTVGVCAFSHAAVGALLGEVLSLARRRGTPVRALQRAEPGQVCPDPDVTRAAGPQDVESALADRRARLVAGTPWLFAAAGMRDRLDVLVVDEAGQLSLANVAAISGSARTLALFGDPQQLAQPLQGVHPPGAQASALGHLLQGRATIPDDRGLLLDETYRMHPEIAAFVSELAYDGRVTVAAGRERQRIESTGPLIGSGLRYVASPQTAGRTAAEVNAGLVAELVAAVLADGGRVDTDGRWHRLLPGDVLVLAGHNRQVHRLRQALDAATGSAGVRVGTVDRHQGGQAPLVLYSLVPPGDGPAAVDFLLDPRRLTVALSRAEALAVVVADPALLLAEVRTPGQLLRVGALNRLVDVALPVRVSGPPVPSAR